MHARTKRSLDDEVESRIRAHIRAWMAEHGLTKAAAARRIGISRSHLSRILSTARGAVGPAILVKIAIATTTNPSVLLFDDPPKRFFAPGSEASKEPWTRGRKE